MSFGVLNALNVFFSFLLLLLNYVYMVWCVHEFLQRPEKGVRSPGARVTGKLPYVVARNQNQAL